MCGGELSSYILSFSFYVARFVRDGGCCHIIIQQMTFLWCNLRNNTQQVRAQLVPHLDSELRIYMPVVTSSQRISRYVPLYHKLLFEHDTVTVAVLCDTKAKVQNVLSIDQVSVMILIL